MATGATTTKDTTGGTAPDADGRPIPFTDADKRTAETSTSGDTPVSFTLPGSGTKVTATAAVRDAITGKAK